MNFFTTKQPKLNLLEMREFQNAYHKWSASVNSFDYRKTPKVLKKMYLKDEDFKIFLQLPYSRTDDGIILINESSPEWKMLKDFFVALDYLPDSLLLDMYKVEIKRGTGGLDDMEECSDDEKKRKIIFQLLPEIIWAHENKK